jgi:hypothetical protein
MKHKIILLLALLQGISVCGQRFREHPDAQEARNKGKAFMFHLGMGTQLPGGDLADRFGLCGSYGGGIDFMTANNFFIGFEGYGLFGKEVKEDPLAILRTPEGYIIANTRTLSSVVLRERGMYLGGTIGKLFPIKAEERRGIRVSLGAGWLQHRILVQDNDRSLTQITGDYAKGYDRLTGGFALNQFFGWQKLGKLKKANFLIGFEFTQGFTQTRRDWDFSEMKKLSGKRLDLCFGIKAAWTMPFYLRPGSEIYY